MTALFGRSAPARGRPELAAPLFLFNSWIQDVAFYNVALDNNIIETHYANGSGLEDL